MKKFILLLSITIFGWAGWWIGAHIGIMTAYLISFISSLLGVYIGVKVNLLEVRTISAFIVILLSTRHRQYYSHGSGHIAGIHYVP